MAYDMMRKKGLGFAGGGAQPLQPAPRAGGGAAPMRPAPRMGGRGAPLGIGDGPAGPGNRGGREDELPEDRLRPGRVRVPDEEYPSGRRGGQPDDQNSRANILRQIDEGIHELPEPEGPDDEDDYWDRSRKATNAYFNEWRQKLKAQGYSDDEIDDIISDAVSLHD